MDGQPSPRAPLRRDDEIKKKKSLSLFAWSFPPTTFEPPRSERDVYLGRFARIEYFSSRISSQCVIIDSRSGRGARVTQNPIRFWRQRKPKERGERIVHKEQRRRFLFSASQKMRKKSRANEEEKTRDANAKRAHRSNDRGEARFLSSKGGKEKREGERETPRVCVCVCLFCTHHLCVNKRRNSERSQKFSRNQEKGT